MPAEYAKAYVNLFRHRTEPLACPRLLAEIDNQGSVPAPRLLRAGSPLPTVVHALWMAALSATFKLLPAETKDAKSSTLQRYSVTAGRCRASYDVLQGLRNRHVLHDENDWMQTVPYAIYGDAGNDQATLE